MMNLLLCGLPTCGKSTLGKEIATQLNWEFVDTDAMIEQAYAGLKGRACSCRQIFQAEGESEFRKLEKQQIYKLSGLKKSVIALGGGALTNPELVSHLKSLGLMVYLNVPLETLWARIKSKGIPPFLEADDPQAKFYALAKERIPIYKQAAQAEVDLGNQTIPEGCKLILNAACCSHESLPNF